jgi:hypothetical protein
MVEECLLKEHLIFEFYENGFFGDTNLLLETYGAVTNIKYSKQFRNNVGYVERRRMNSGVQ